MSATGMQRACSSCCGQKATQVAMEYGYETQSGFNKAFFDTVRLPAAGIQEKRGGVPKRYEERKGEDVSVVRQM